MRNINPSGKSKQYRKKKSREKHNFTNMSVRYHITKWRCVFLICHSRNHFLNAMIKRNKEISKSVIIFEKICASNRRFTIEHDIFEPTYQ